MQCNKIEKFVKGTDSKSANLPQIFQSLHSHTAMTNFVVCSGSLTESTQGEADPSAECRANTESSRIDSETLTESNLIDSESKLSKLESNLSLDSESA